MNLFVIKKMMKSNFVLGFEPLETLQDLVEAALPFPFPFPLLLLFVSLDWCLSRW
jgi:hypothetical protein